MTASFVERFVRNPAVQRAAMSALLAMAVATALAVGKRAFAQAPGGPAFVVATIKPSENPNPGGFFSYPGPGRFSAPNFSLRTLISFAYGLGIEVTGGPDWIGETRYNVQAQAEGNPSRDEMALMLRNLLAERFAVKLHKETKEVDVYAMVLARQDGKLGPKVEVFEGECGNAPPAKPCPALIQPVGLRLGGQPMSMLATLLSANVTGLGRRVEDRTGLTGRYNINFEFRFTPPGGKGPAPEPDPLAPSIFTVLQEQIGVKLESSRGNQEFIVVESAQRPTAN